MNQCDRILAYMTECGPISQAEAIREFGIYRLAARISDLRKAGYKISKKSKTEKNRFGDSVTFAVYELMEE